MPMRKEIKVAAAVFGSLVLIWFLLGILFLVPWPVNQKATIETIRIWADLAELPSGATDISVNVKGNQFARGLELSFRAPVNEIEQWIKNSPGPMGAVPSKRQAGGIQYRFTNEGGRPPTTELIWDGDSVLVSSWSS